MERVRTGSPSLGRQQSVASTASSSTGAPSSPIMSPVHRHARSGSQGAASAFRRQQNVAARAAAQRLARVMAHQSTGDDSDDDLDDLLDLDGPPPGLSTPRRRATPASVRSPSPALGRYLAEQKSTLRPTSVARPSAMTRPGAVMPPVKPPSRLYAGSPAQEAPSISQKEKRMSVDFGNLNARGSGTSLSTSAFHHELVETQVEDENLSEKGITEFPSQSVGPKSDDVASLSFEAKGTTETPSQRFCPRSDGAATLRFERKISGREATSTTEHIQEAECETKETESASKPHRVAEQKMLLSEEELEEVILKRCWLSRYWKLCLSHGIHADIAETKHEYWSSFAPFPLETVLSAGQKIRDGNSSDRGYLLKDKSHSDLSDLAGEETVESMLLVEKGLRELAYLKVEDAVLIAMAQQRRAHVKVDSIPPTDGPTSMETFELSQEESEDVLFKQAWLTYFWRRMKDHGLEEDIADERLQYWINQSSHSPTSQDAVDAEHGLFELRKLGVESQLWAATRREAIEGL